MNLPFYRACNLLGRGLAATLANVHVSGIDNIPAKGPLILVSNHLNNVDPVLLAIFFTRPVHFLTKVELLRIPVVGTLADWYGCVPVRRGEFDRGAINRCLELLEAGEAIGVFPEGTRSRTRGLQRPKAGLSLLAGRSGAPILPVGIAGTENARGISIVWEHPRIQIQIGEPFTLPLQRGRIGHGEFADQVMIRIARLLPPEYRGMYRDHPDLAPDDSRVASRESRDA